MSATYTPFTYSHPALGSLTGRLTTQHIISKTAQVVQFRSVSFATIPARFKLAHGPLDRTPQAYDARPERDFTQWGFACPQVEQDRLAGGGSLGEDDVRRYDEFACLNCTISVPKKALDGELGDLPVMVYLHGGAFVEGCGNIAASHDTSRMVALSVEQGTPVIIVSLHYRLNWFGFFVCSDLLEEARAARDGFVADLGLRDQRLGFQWVQRQIAGFGGDAANVTAFGESGGSISLVHQLCGTEPLFQRVILQSGIVGCPGDDLERRDAMYERLLQYLDIRATSAKERLRALRDAPVDRLVEAVIDLELAPAWPFASREDPFYADGPPAWSKIGLQIADCSWCHQVIAGDSSFEGFMLQPPPHRATGNPPLLPALSSILHPADAQALCTYYDIDAALPANLLWTNVARLAGDIAFSEPSDKVAGALSARANKRIYRYHVGLSNPFPGSVFSYVTGHHFVELIYLFLTYLERYPTHRGDFSARVAREMAGKWIEFANGRAPWEAHVESEGHAIAVFDDRRGLDVRTREEDEKISEQDVWGERRNGGMRLIRTALENVACGDAARGMILNAFL